MSIHHSRLQVLLFNALHATCKPGARDLFEGITELERQELLLIATRQGVNLIAYEGLSFLPKAYRPSSRLHLKWYLSVVRAEKRFEHYNETLESLALLLTQGGVKRILVLKGVTIASYYQNPARREGGDIDLFLFQDTQRADEIIAQTGIAIDFSSDKAAHFIYQGVEVENHSVLFDPEMQFAREDMMYKQASTMLTELFTRPNGVLPFSIGRTKVYQLAPQANALYTILHLFRHTTCLLLVYRQFCDFVVTFNALKKQLNLDILREQLQSLDLVHFVVCVELYCQKYLGYHPYLWTHYEDVPQEHVDYLEEIIMLFGSDEVYLLPGTKAIKYKLMRQKAYNYYFGSTSYFECFIPELLSYIGNKTKKIMSK